MDIPITNPHASAELSMDDHSNVDDSFKQTGTNITFGDGAVYNQNCGNQKELSRRRSMWTTIILSTICDAVIIYLMHIANANMTLKIVEAEERGTAIH